MMQTRLPLARRARSATSTTITTSLLSQVILIVSGVFAARLLGVEDRGRLALLVLVPAALAQVGALGLPVAVTYYVARDPKSSRAIVQRVVPVAIAQAAVLVAVQAAILAVLVQSSHVGWTPACSAFLSFQRR